MATVEVGNGAVLDVAGRIGPRRSLWRGTRFITEVFDGADDALAALEAVQGGLASTRFQTLDWRTVLYEELAPSQARDAAPRRCDRTQYRRDRADPTAGHPKKRTLTVAFFADLGVSDYGGPILGPAVLKKRRSIRGAPFVERCVASISLVSSACPHKSANCLIR